MTVSVSILNFEDEIVAGFGDLRVYTCFNFLFSQYEVQPLCDF